MSENKQGLFLIFAVLLFLINIELIKQTFTLTKELFIFELLFIIFLGLMALDSMNEFTKRNLSCFSVLSIFFGLNLVNTVGISLSSNIGLNISLLIMSGLGFIIALFNIQKKDEEDLLDNEEPSVEVHDPEETQKVEVYKQSTKKEFSPGKFLASKTGKKYHSPKCDFAKKIPKRNYVWFDTKNDAKKKGYGPCKCI